MINPKLLFGASLKANAFSIKRKKVCSFVITIGGKAETLIFLRCLLVTLQNIASASDMT